jgi:hypothetical protein
MDLGKKVRTGEESEPIKAPDVFPPREPEHEPQPEVAPDFTRVLVPVRREQSS